MHVAQDILSDQRQSRRLIGLAKLAQHQQAKAPVQHLRRNRSDIPGSLMFVHRDFPSDEERRARKQCARAADEKAPATGRDPATGGRAGLRQSSQGMAPYCPRSAWTIRPS
ncbi:hypothetical protein Ms3S1_19560 [Methylosinus sp. 3S-1]